MMMKEDEGRDDIPNVRGHVSSHQLKNFEMANQLCRELNAAGAVSHIEAGGVSVQYPPQCTEVVWAVLGRFGITELFSTTAAKEYLTAVYEHGGLQQAVSRDPLGICGRIVGILSNGGN